MALCAENSTVTGEFPTQRPWRCFTNVSRALQNIISKMSYCGNSTCYANFNLKLCACAQGHALGTRTRFKLEIIARLFWRAHETLVKQPPETHSFDVFLAVRLK